MKNILLLFLTSFAVWANGQSQLQYKLDLHLDALFDKGEIRKVKKINNPTIEFVRLNNYKIKIETFDSLTLPKKLTEIFKERQQTSKLTIVDSKDRIYKEYVLIVGQLHRVLLRVKDTVSKERLGVHYKEIIHPDLSLGKSSNGGH
jgi:hypothetical protein